MTPRLFQTVLIENEPGNPSCRTGMRAGRNRIGDAGSWWLLAGMAGACLLACRGLNFTIDPARAAAPTIGVVVLWSSAIFARTRGLPRLALGATAFLQMTLFTVLGVVLAYAFAAQGNPLWDDTLAAADAWLGFNWAFLFHAADHVPVALWIGGLAYHSLTIQMIVCIVVLSATNRADALRMAVVAAISSGFATVAISGLVPAAGNLFNPAGYHHLWPSIAWLERDLIAGLRDGSGRVLDLSVLMGIVSFPSFHATLPVILAWAQRDVSGMCVIATIWGAVTVMATPLFGGHYAVDVLAGLALAVPAIALASLLSEGRQQGAGDPA